MWLALSAGAGAAPAPHEADAGHADRYGDPLPPGALMRLGTVRFRHATDPYLQCTPLLVYSPDGKTLATAGQGGKIRLWDAATGKGIASFQQGGGRTISALAFSPDGKTLAVGDLDLKSFALDSAAPAEKQPAKLVLRDAATGDVRQTFEDEGGFHHVVFFPDGKRLAASAGPRVHLWDWAAAKEFPLPFRGSPAWLVLAPDGNTLAYRDKEAVVLWDAAEGKEVRRVETGLYGVSDVAFSPDGKTLAGSGARTAVTASPQLLRLWDRETGKELHTLAENDSAGFCFAFSADGKTLASTAGDRGPIRLWDVAAGKERGRLHIPASDFLCVDFAFSPDGKTLAAATGHGAVSLWDPETLKRIDSFDAHEAPVVAVALSPDGRTWATGSRDGTVRLWDRATGKPLRLLEHEGSVDGPDAVAFSPDGRRLTSLCSFYHSLRVWDAASGREIEEKPETPDEPRFLLDGGFTAQTVTAESALALRDAGGPETARLKGVSPFGPNPIASVVLSADGKTLAMRRCFPEVQGGPNVGLWDVASGRALHGVGGGSAGAVALSPDGRTAATAEDGAVRLWDAATGAELYPLRQEGILHLCYSPDGKMLATASPKDPAIRLWETATGAERLRLPGHAEGTMVLAFAPDGPTLISGGTDATALVWDLAPPGWEKGAPAGVPRPDDLDRLWSDLADADADRAYRAAWALGAARGAVDFLKGRLKPDAGDLATKTRRLIADLDGDDLETRQAASRGLAELGAAALPAVADALADKPSPEQRRREQEFLESLRQKPPRLPAEELQALRALEVLERVGTPEARRLVETLAGGGEARVTREAREALARLEKRPGADR
jgi:WD40 repeat protein